MPDVDGVDGVDMVDIVDIVDIKDMKDIMVIIVIIVIIVVMGGFPPTAYCLSYGADCFEGFGVWYAGFHAPGFGYLPDAF